MVTICGNEQRNKYLFQNLDFFLCIFINQSWINVQKIDEIRKSFGWMEYHAVLQKIFGSHCYRLFQLDQ